MVKVMAVQSLPYANGSSEHPRVHTNSTIKRTIGHYRKKNAHPMPIANACGVEKSGGTHLNNAAGVHAEHWIILLLINIAAQSPHRI